MVNKSLFSKQSHTMDNKNNFKIVLFVVNLLLDLEWTFFQLMKDKT